MKLVEEERHREETDSGMLTIRNFEDAVFNSRALCFRRLHLTQSQWGGRPMVQGSEPKLRSSSLPFSGRTADLTAWDSPLGLLVGSSHCRILVELINKAYGTLSFALTFKKIRNAFFLKFHSSGSEDPTFQRIQG